VNEPNELHFLKSLISEHVRLTGSQIGKRVLLNWQDILSKFVKVFPQDLKLIMSTESARRLDEFSKDVDVPTHSPQITTMLDRTVLDIEDAIEDIVLEKSTPGPEVDKLRGFMKYQRESDKYRDPLKRSKDWKEVNSRLGKSELKVQAARCMVSFQCNEIGLRCCLLSV
jgi:glutamate synthase (NADPH/NADH)